MTTRETSSLSPVPSIPTPSSFFTARSSPVNTADVSNASNTSNTGSTSPFELDEWGKKKPSEPVYRDARPLREALKQECQIQLEDHLYLSAIQLLDVVLHAGNAPPPSNDTQAIQTTTTPAWVAPPNHLALLASLAIHPLFTSRPKEREEAQIAPHALRYLRGVLRTVGPLNADLRSALDFRGRVGSRRDRREHDPDNLYASDDDMLLGGGGAFRNNNNSSGSSRGAWDRDKVRDKFAAEQSVWRRGSGFWDVVGWAFGCAASHPRRWRHWKVWLEFMIDALEADWAERLRRDEAAHAEKEENKQEQQKGKGIIEGQEEQDEDDDDDAEGRGTTAHCNYRLLRRSIIAGYVDALREERKNTLKEIMRALFAFTDNSQADRAFYAEVFPRETAPPASPSNIRDAKRKRAQMSSSSLPDGDGGDDDWADDDSFAWPMDGGEEGQDGEQAEAEGKRRSRRKGRLPAQESSGPPFRLTDAMAETVPLRLRLFALVSANFHYLPRADSSDTSLRKLYGEFAAATRQKPLGLFRLLVDSHATPLRDDVYVTLVRSVARALLPDHPDPADADPDTDATGGLSVAILRACYLPFAVNRVFAADNAKLSVLLENMLWFLDARRGFESGSSLPYKHSGLRDAVERGIRAREEKVRRRRGAAAQQGGGGVDPQEVAAREALDRSARGLRMLMDEIEFAEGDD